MTQTTNERARQAYERPEATLLELLWLPSLLASLSAEGGLGEYEDDGEL